MKKDTLILKDGTVINIEAAASLSAIPVKSESRSEMLATWEKLTEDNLSAVQIKNGYDTTIGTYEDLVLVSESSIVAADGTVVTTYALREKTSEEKRLDALESSQEVQDGAITELAEMAAGGEA